LSGIKDIVTGAWCVCFLLNDGRLYGAGNFHEGGGNRTAPVLLLSGVARVVGAYFQFHALKTDGTWWSFGNNNSGQLGVGTSTNVIATAAVQNPMLNAAPVRSIACGSSSTIVIRANGVVIAAGIPGYYKGVDGSNNTSGEIRTGLPTNVATTVFSSNSSVNWITYDGKIYTAGSNGSYQAGTAGPDPKPIGLITPPFTLAPLSRAPTWNTASALSAISTGTALNVRLDATDARLYKVVSGSLPTGLSLSADGLLSGTPSAGGVFAFTVRAFGMTSGAFADRAFTVEVLDSASVLLRMGGAHGSSVFVDSSSKARNVIATGNVTISNEQSVYGGTSARFVGPGAHLSLGSGADFAFGTGDFTIEAFVYRESGSSAPIYEAGSWGTNGSLGININTGNSKLIVSLSGEEVIADTIPPPNVWTHYAVVRYNSVVTIFYNGTAVATGPLSGNVTHTTPVVGRLISVNGYDMTGYLDEYRVSKLARYKSNFTPSA
jgi:hypothetical protein